MFFTVLANRVRAPAEARLRAFLLTDNWDDWFKYNTLFSLVVFDAAGAEHRIGGVKIGQFDMEEGQRSAAIPVSFDELDERFFSLGQDDSYYEDLNRLGPELRDRVLRGLRDIARDQELFGRALNEKVTGVSLLRSVTPATVQGQFSRLARGGARLSRYEFNYTAPRPVRSRARPITLSFVVEPESQPPTNIHVLIGRNGVGKTHLLHHMTRALVEESAEANLVGAFTGDAEDIPDGGRLFANLVSVTFSAFDPFEPLPVRQDKSEGVQYAYIGLKRGGTTADGKPLAPKNPDRLAAEFGKSVWICRQGARVSRWRRALEMLEADPIFKDAEVAALADTEVEEDELQVQARKLFEKLSSGHKIVLLTITRLVETVEERTLVLLDEPEAHLHPPLLSAFVRALSDLLVNRNGVAIIATHSPVVLQEVPGRCAWKIRRNGARVEAERPEIETFGENVGILTREVFGLEVAHSGFHKMLRDAVEEDADFRVVLERFGGELGAEAKAIVRALLAAQQAEDDL
jgi:ABC-type branched-subunit amino acid transport system ATPase component